MTRISPLANTHKIGLYGDYKAKHETDLLAIREISNVKIFQLSKYKMSNMDLSNFSLEGYKFPIKGGSSSGNNSLRIQWQAPNIWIIIFVVYYGLREFIFTSDWNK